MRELTVVLMVAACSGGDAARIDKLEKRIAELEGVSDVYSGRFANHGKEIDDLIARRIGTVDGPWWCAVYNINWRDAKTKFMAHYCSHDESFCRKNNPDCEQRRIAYCTNDGGGECFSNLESCNQVIKFDGALATKNTFCIGVE